MSIKSTKIFPLIENLSGIQLVRLWKRLFRGILLMSPAERKGALWLLCSSLLNALLQMAALVSIIPGIMLMLGLSELSLEYAPIWLEQFLDQADKRSIYFIFSGGVITLILIKAAYDWLHTEWMLQFVAGCERRLSLILMSRILVRDYKWQVKQNSSWIRQTVVGFVPSWAREFVGRILILATDLVLGAIIITVLIVADPVPGLLVIIFAFLFASAIFLFIRPKYLRLAMTKRNSFRSMDRVCADVFLGIKEIKMVGAEDKVSEIFDEQAKQFANAEARAQQWMRVPRILLELIVYGGLVGVSMFVISFDWQSEKTSGLIILYGLSAIRLVPIFSTLVANLTTLLGALPVVDDICALMEVGAETEPTSTDDDWAKTSWHKISFTEVSFSYEKGARAAIQDISLTINRGLSYGVVGPSGSGKSTAIDLIAGLLEPTTGVVQVDGIPLTMDNRRFWRRRFGYVVQCPFLLDASLQDNITFNFTSKVDEERLERAIQLACLDQVVARLSKGIASRIGERGNLLSGGEQQRVAIARALYRGADILILDEATSSLDTLVEREVMQSIEILQGVVTTIIVSHRFGLVRECDEIWVFNEAGLSAKGTHDELSHSSSLYCQMTA